MCCFLSLSFCIGLTCVHDFTPIVHASNVCSTSLVPMPWILSYPPPLARLVLVLENINYGLHVYKAMILTL